MQYCGGMPLRPRPAALALAALLFPPLVLGAGPVLACACCTDQGFRSVGSGPIGKLDWPVFHGLLFASTASVVFDPAASGPGLPEDLTVTVEQRKGRRLTFRFGSPTGATGTLAFDLPRTMGWFAVDPHPEAASGPNGPVLYLEWTVRATPTATGMMSPFAGPGRRIALILHGHGNACPSVEDFHAWSLTLTGGRRPVTFTGALASRRPEPPARRS